MKGQGIVLCTMTSGVFWALFIGYVNALAPHYAAIGYGVTGAVAFIMCYQARHKWLSFVPGTFIGASAMFASNGDWFHVVPALWIGLLFGCAMRIAAHGLQTLAARSIQAPAANVVRRQSNLR
ncbi:hypothetical protein TUM12370_23750 [Salmonella enterica subsp. enterica serovar Choleraesuis]|nr:hypothetical protein TUM12370_23750 [Salmonella enterica subsp. enterica serovar Choleraesuis]